VRAADLAILFDEGSSMKQLLRAAVFSLALAGLGGTSFAADPVPKPPDVTKDAEAYVQAITEKMVCAPEEGTTGSFTCTTLVFATPFSFRCVITEATKDVKAGVVCQVPMPAAESIAITK
jgi:hypothetical protein